MATHGEDVPISQPITGTHLQSENLSHKIQADLARIGDWAEKGEFVPLTEEIQRCSDKDKMRKVEPVLKALNYKVRNPF
jgi:hypothetical protein